MKRKIVQLLRKIKRRIWRGLARWMNLTYKLPNGVNLKVESYSDWCTIGDLFMNGEYDKAIDLSLRTYNKQEPFVFLDLGANVGFFTHRLLYKANLLNLDPDNFRGLLVEATPSLIPELIDRLAPWHKMGAELKICSAAVGNRKGNAQMKAGRAHSRNSLTLPANNESWSIPFIDLDCEEIAKNKIDLIKCDIEGAEVLFLNEYPELLKRCKALVIECHPPACSEIFVRSHLEPLGFIYDSKLRNDPEGITLFFTKKEFAPGNSNVNSVGQKGNSV